MTPTQPDRFDDLEATLETVVKQLTKLDTDVRTDIKALSERVERTNDRVEIYQKASGQVVNLAFGLLTAAVIAIIIPVIVGHN
jgi:tetrahydromethanopterin S-methyltransferase subunit G